MATAVHCLVCFEALDANLDNRKALSLSEIEASYALYTSSLAGPANPSSSSFSSSPSSSASASAARSPTTSTPATSTSSLPLDAGPAPLFVTWNTVDGEDDDGDGDDDGVSLRGCIGTFEPRPLAQGLPEYAIISALHDTRFPPISKAELPSLQAAVTLLTDFEEARDPHDWEVGTHGIRLSFTDAGRRFGATYLPDVAAEQGWTKDEALYSLVRKAGWGGSRSRWSALELKLTRYQGRKASLGYPEFKRWRDWLAARQ